MTDLEALPTQTSSQATSLNDSGQVVGYSTGAGYYSPHAFVYSNGSLQELFGLPGMLVNYAFAINNAGQAVGMSGGTSGYHAVLWDNGAVIDLDPFLPTTSAWSSLTQVAATGINDPGQIVGYAADYNMGMPSGFRGFMLTPVSPPPK